MSDEKLNIRPDGIETLEGGLENYQLDNPENEEEEVGLELTFDEMKKYLRGMGNKKVTDEEVEKLTDEQIEEIKEYAKLKERKSIYKFVYRKKTVTDDDVKDLTEEEVKELTAKAMIMAQHLTYQTKKDFGAKYKKKRQTKNNLVKKSRRANR